MISPLPRNKRAKNPHADGAAQEEGSAPEKKPEIHAEPRVQKAKVPVAEAPATGGLNNPFANLDLK
jgi:hypothetical protein